MTISNGEFRIKDDHAPLVMKIHAGGRGGWGKTGAAFFFPIDFGGKDLPEEAEPYTPPDADE